MSNKEIIFNLVEKYFSLDTNSLKKFERKLYEPDIDEVYKELLKDSEDYRIKIPIPDESLYSIDRGWEDFRYHFSSFVNKHSVSYSDFRRNKVKINKQDVKIFKALREYYEDSLPEHKIQRLMEEIGAKKFPKGESNLVLSLNFADWFMCATGERWSSCLNLESDYEGAFWAGLPGLIGDKNRALIYISNGTRKKFDNISVEKFLSRSWLLLDEESNINVVRFYPSRIFGYSEINRIFGTDKFTNLGSYYSKHKVDLLFHTNGYSSFIYQDGTTFCDKGSMKDGDAGMYCYDKDMRRHCTDFFYCCGGIRQLIEENKNIADFTEDDVCPCCERRGYESIEVDGSIYCENCVNSYTRTCEECGECHVNDFNWVSTNEGYVCESCFEENYEMCTKCNEPTRIDDATIVGDDILCRSCFEENEENIFCCDDCDKHFYKEKLKYIEEIDEEICIGCYKKALDKYQLKFDFAA